LRLAIDDADRVTRLVLVNAGGVTVGAVRLALVGYGFAVAKALVGHRVFTRRVARVGRLRRASMWLFLHDPRTLSPQLAAEIIPRLPAVGLVDAVRAATAEVGRADPSDLRLPVLLVWGAHDRILPLRLAQDLLEDLPDGRLEVVATAGHCPMIEAPVAFNEAVLGFLGQRAPTQRADPPGSPAT
ncbi:MAG: alpha/beta hydrolase, partial [Solirubrobacterales bacterium]|nr:alpha/beta hydrolase [Solirubrobacterales bacterium]